jgi:arsenate reductase
LVTGTPPRIEDPAAVEGTEFEKLSAFATAFNYLKNRISLFATLPLACPDRMALKERLNRIGSGADATGGR